MRHKRHKMLTDREKEKAVLLHNQGVERRYIAERLGVSPQTIGNIIRGWKDAKNVDEV